MSHSVQEFFLNKKIGLQEIFFQKAPPPPPPQPPQRPNAWPLKVCKTEDKIQESILSAAIVNV